MHGHGVGQFIFRQSKWPDFSERIIRHGKVGAELVFCIRIGQNDADIAVKEIKLKRVKSSRKKAPESLSF